MRGKPLAETPNQVNFPICARRDLNLLLPGIQLSPDSEMRGNFLFIGQVKGLISTEGSILYLDFSAALNSLGWKA